MSPPHAQRYVALDTETTGRDPESDEVIEVGAIAFTLEGVLGEYQTLVRPFKAPQYFIERLTGIMAAELESAPRFAAIAAELREFIADSPIVGQNVEFDLAFLDKQGIRPSAAGIDTFDLAQLLLPGLSDYSLRGLANHLGVEFPVWHRAQTDADATRLVFLALRERLAALPRWLLEQVERLALAGSWSLGAVVSEVLAAGGGARTDAPGVVTEEILAKPQEIPRAPQPIKDGREVTAAESVALLAAAGKLRQHFADFERRAEQEQMAASVTDALREGNHLVVEAGTGVGKSLAYLLPAALHALRNGERVLVSTDTIGLQEQLIAKDLPVVQEVVERAEGMPLRIAQLKGRRNYLCLQRWNAARFTPPVTKEDARLQARLLVWLTADADRRPRRAEPALHLRRRLGPALVREHALPAERLPLREAGDLLPAARPPAGRSGAHPGREPRAAPVRHRDRRSRPAVVLAADHRRGAQPRGRGDEPPRVPGRGGRRQRFPRPRRRRTGLRPRRPGRTR